jgi:hypothetical protein
VDCGSRSITFELKCARINIANRSNGAKLENWAFVNLQRSPGKAEKQYDVLIAIGIAALGLEDGRYWEYLNTTFATLRANGHAAKVDALPHEAEFLSLCSFFIIPRTRLKTNYFRVHLHCLTTSYYSSFHAWGHDQLGCRQKWSAAISELGQV